MTMHEDQLELDDATAARLIRALLPQTAGLEIRRLDTAATTSHVFRVGHALTARFPLQRSDPAAALAALEAEHRAMAEFAEHCPAPAPHPVAIGPASPAFPLPWSVQTWVPGEPATPSSHEASSALAEDLADLIAALRRVDVRGRPVVTEGRGGTLADHDDWVRLCLERSEDLLNVPLLRAMWESWRDLPAPSVLTMSHRDLIPANLLTDGPGLVGVLDTGGFAPADPALDLVAGWHLLDRDRRALLRGLLQVPDAEWERGAAWAFAQAIGLVWYYDDSNPVMAELGRSTLRRLMEDAPTPAPAIARVKRERAVRFTWDYMLLLFWEVGGDEFFAPEIEELLPSSLVDRIRRWGSEMDRVYGSMDLDDFPGAPASVERRLEAEYLGLRAEIEGQGFRLQPEPGGFPGGTGAIEG